MTEITFHLNVNPKLEYCCRLLRKAYVSGATVVVKGSAELLPQLDQMLWSFSPTEFIPHCSASEPQNLLTVTPIVLAPNIESIEALPHHQVLLNIGEEVATGYEKFERVIEIVGPGEADKAHARARWKHYTQRGYPVKTHESKMRQRVA